MPHVCKDLLVFRLCTLCVLIVLFLIIICITLLACFNNSIRILRLFSLLLQVFDFRTAIVV